MTVRDHMILALAARRYPHHAAGARTEAIRTELGMSETRYGQVLTRLLDDAEAEREYPTLVHRLRRLRDARRSAFISA